MIPKKIHYCWLSDEPLPALFQKCMESWQTHLPDYELILWDFNRFDKETSVWVQQAFENKKYAFAADYIRLFAVYHHGGFYLDLDVEVLKSLDDFLNLKTAICWQKNFDGLEVAAFGAEKGASWLKDCLARYKNRPFVLENGGFDMETLPLIVENILKEKKYSFRNASSIAEVKALEKDGDFPVLSSSYFSPKSYKTGKVEIKPCTYTVHHFAASWCGPNVVMRLWRFFHLPDTGIRKKLANFFLKNKT